MIVTEYRSFFSSRPYILKNQYVVIRDFGKSVIYFLINIYYFASTDEFYTFNISMYKTKTALNKNICTTDYTMHQYYFLFFSSLSLSSVTGAAGMLNHHSFNLLVNLSVLAFLGGEYLVNISKKSSRTMHLVGKKAKIKAVDRRPKANFSVAWLSYKWNQLIMWVWHSSLQWILNKILKIIF